MMVYDSLYSTLSLHIQKQIAALLHTTARKIKVNMMDLQAGTSDCGLFAIASATALAHGIQPGSFSFNQSMKTVVCSGIVVVVVNGYIPSCILSLYIYYYTEKLYTDNIIILRSI